MKKTTWTFVAFIAACYCPSNNSQAASGSVLKFGIHLNSSGFLDAQIKRSTNEFLKIADKKLGQKSEVVLENNPANFLGMLKKGGLSFWYAYQPTNFPASAMTAYEPLVFPTLLRKRNHQGCLFVKSDFKGNSLKTLKGKHVQAYDNFLSYSDLRNMIGAAPETFFGKLNPNQSGQSSLYALSLGQIDAAFVFDFNLELLKKINPGPVKKVKKLICSNTRIPLAAIYVKKSLPPEKKGFLVREYINLSQKPEYRHINGLMKSFGMVWQKITPNDYRDMNGLVAKAKTAGWHKDHALWLKYNNWKKVLPVQ